MQPHLAPEVLSLSIVGGGKKCVKPPLVGPVALLASTLGTHQNPASNALSLGNAHNVNGSHPLSEEWQKYRNFLAFRATMHRSRSPYRSG